MQPTRLLAVSELAETIDDLQALLPAGPLVPAPAAGSQRAQLTPATALSTLRGEMALMQEGLLESIKALIEGAPRRG